MGDQTQPIPPSGPNRTSSGSLDKQIGQQGAFKRHSVETDKAPEAKQQKSREASVVSKSGGFWSRVKAGAVSVFDQARAAVTAKTGIITSQRVHLDDIIWG